MAKSTKSKAQEAPVPAQPADASSEPQPKGAGESAKVGVRYNANENTYELTADVNGAPVVFATVKAGLVESAQGVHAAADEAGSGSASSE